MSVQIIFDSIINNWIIISLFFTVAILYSSVGFGGGSSYLAILALTGMAFTQIRATALLCNIVVVSGNMLLFYKQDSFNWKKLFPLIIFSIPLSYLGGKLEISQKIFFILLGFTLFFAAISMWASNRIISSNEKKGDLSLSKNASYGGVIGLISGMAGIGGGVFLAPLLHLTNWDTPKRIAATASLFILLNSISGILGYSFNSDVSVEWDLAIMLIMVVLAGSFLGNRISQQFLTPIQIKKGTAILIAFVSIRILLKIF